MSTMYGGKTRISQDLFLSPSFYLKSFKNIAPYFIINVAFSLSTTALVLNFALGNT